MTTLLASDIHQTAFSIDHFGGNILAHRDSLGPDGTYAEAADLLDLNSIRYPGGSLTERYFDISDPDRTLAPDSDGEGLQPLISFSEFMAFAEASGRSALIVLPTRSLLSDTADANGDRFSAVDEDALRTFIRDTLDGTYGSPRIAGFEIGNEYWDSGQMTSVEYGRIASEMAVIIRDELQSHPDFDSRFQDTDILVQMGMNYGYGSMEDRYSGTSEEQLAQFAEDYGLQLDGDYIYSNGNVAWPQLANLLVMREFDLPEERAAIDAIVAHSYSRGEFASSSHYFSLQTLTSTWSEEFPDLDIAVTEWNIRNRGRDEEEDYGLTQATEMLDLLEAMTLYGADSAHIYPVQQRSPSSLTGDEGEVEERLAGTFFRMVHETLPGTRPVVLEGASGRESELVTANGEIHAFAGDDRMVFYVTSTVEEGEGRVRLDFSELFTDFDAMTLETLGVAPGESPGDARSTPVRTELDPATHYINGVLRVDLAPREILEVVVTGVQYTADMEAVLSDQPVEDAEPEIVIPDDAIYVDGPPTVAPSEFANVSVLSDGSVLATDADGQNYVFSSASLMRVGQFGSGPDGDAEDDPILDAWATLVVEAEEAARAEEDDEEDGEGVTRDADGGGMAIDGLWALLLLPLLGMAQLF